MLRIIRNISLLQNILIATISFILVINTNFSTLNLASSVDCVAGYAQSRLVSVIKEYLYFAKNENNSNCQEASSSNSPIEEENRALEEELIFHDSEICMAITIKSQLSNIMAQHLCYEEPHIEYLTPPPEA